MAYKKTLKDKFSVFVIGNGDNVHLMLDCANPICQISDDHFSAPVFL